MTIDLAVPIVAPSRGEVSFRADAELSGVTLLGQSGEASTGTFGEWLSGFGGNLDDCFTADPLAPFLIELSFSG